MALNWFLTLRNLAKTDANAAALMEQLKTAGTDDEKETAKKTAQEYIQKIQSNESDSHPTPEENVVVETNPVVAEQDRPDVHESDVETDTEDRSASEETQEKKIMLDLSQPAFTPRLAKYGITREEELFLNGVFVRKMDRNEKILMRRSIYQKKTQVAAKIQAEYKAKRIAQKEKDARDPEKIRFHQERKYISAIVNALEEHKNLGWVFSNIEGLTLDVFRDLMKKPGNVNAINAANPNFLANFRKKYGE